VAAADLTIFAVAAPGLEDVVARECAALPGVAAITKIVGGVEFTGDARVVLAANERLRIASRVLVRVGTFTARDFARLVKETAKLDWTRFAVARGEIEVKATARRSRLYHTGAIAERVILGIEQALPAGGASTRMQIIARVEDDEVTLSIDSSGELLHRRGARVETAKAPLRETLAAGLLALAAWDPRTEALVDPMCGAGTIALEAASLALGRQPGANRTFACEAWPTCAGVSRTIIAGADRLPRPIVASDRDAGAVEITTRNLARAELSPHVTVRCADARDAELPDPPGLVLVNAPYDVRVRAGTGGAYAALAALRSRARGFRLAVLTTDESLLRPLGARPIASHPLDNGGLRVRLFLFAPPR
jgi:putative N6-adenine-specific DNA methylase